jgi:hypothetical protein
LVSAPSAARLAVDGARRLRDDPLPPFDDARRAEA